jgi:flagellar M-ring protein FliF
MKGLLDSLRKLGMAPILALTGVLIGMIGIVVFLELGGVSTSRMTLLYSDLDLHDSSQIVDQLERHQVPYRVEADGKRIMVAGDDVFTARAMLAKEGLPTSGTVGNEIFDRNNDLALTEFDQDVKRSRALEGELARTIEAMHGISRARVHLVLPRKEPFAHSHREAQASVMLTLVGSQTLPQEGIQAIVNLVAGAVPDLRPENITVVDSHLHLLARAGDPEDIRTRSMLADDLSRTMGLRLARSVEEMLERSLGNGHVHAEASVRINFDRTNDTQERFDPDGTVVRSTQNVTSNNKATDKAGPVSLQNNLPNSDPTAQASGTQESRQEETTNYEITKTIHNTTRDQPQVDRITLAVMVDGVDEVGPDGKHVWRTRPQQDLDRIERLAKSAIGFDEKRGDRVEVVSMPFISTIDQTEPERATRPDMARRDLVSLAEAVALGVTAFVIIVLMSRSIIRGLKGAPVSMTMAGRGPEGFQLADPGMGGALALTGSDPGRGSPDGSQGALMDESTVSLNQIEGQIRASSIRQLIDLTNRHPDTTLAIIRGWMAG